MTRCYTTSWDLTRRGDPVPWTHWFAEHAHIHADPADAPALTVPPAPGR